MVLDSGAECADDLFMFVRCKTRRKDGKEHRYWSVVENVALDAGTYAAGLGPGMNRHSPEFSRRCGEEGFIGMTWPRR